MHFIMAFILFDESLVASIFLIIPSKSPGDNCVLQHQLMGKQEFPQKEKFNLKQDKYSFVTGNFNLHVYGRAGLPADTRQRLACSAGLLRADSPGYLAINRN